ncbi:MAG: hypothetical protein ACF8Q5_07015 [Phycisphaerales bacterium JB040]
MSAAGSHTLDILPESPSDHPRPGVSPAQAPLHRVLFSSRPGRVKLLLILVVALSLVDLELTLMYASTIGMPEMNPLARTLMRHGSATDLVLWKLGTIALSTGILFRLRAQRAAEIGAWIALVALAWLTGQWIAYANLHQAIADIGPVIDYDIAAMYDPNWVELGIDPNAP